ncbi:hypothetical protein V493_06816 [Pseudogymnoascus sp. VKM F-4281 (FW-2241)]|nr:hypothetical protein V493_06816 [Pseudogymnoascus sp. VKM F-4281 (FW-2241)]
MARRTSSRAASHDQASSPPKPDRRTVRSPQKRSTRATRSQSRDLDEPYAPALRQTARRNARQGSVDSVGSDASAANNGRGKKVRGSAPIQPELSMVAEDEETQGSLRNEEEAREFPNIQQLPEPTSGLSEISQPAPVIKSLLPAAQIKSNPRGTSLYKGRVSVSALFPKNLKTSAAPPSNQQQLQQQVVAGPSAPKTPVNNAIHQVPSTAPAKTSQEVDPEADGNRPSRYESKEMAIFMTKSDAEKNKENRPLPTETIPQASAATTLPADLQPKSFIERQANAHRVPQISDSDVYSQPESSSRQRAKRTREESEEPSEHGVAAAVDEDETSEDDGFEQDRARLPSRMRNPPPEVIQVTGGPRKRARINSRIAPRGPAEEVQSRQPRINTISRLQQQPGSGRVRSDNTSVSSVEEELTEQMEAVHEARNQASQYDAVRDMARQQGQAHRLNIGPQKQTQTRVKWSSAEEDGFIRLIEQYGTGWSDLFARGQDEDIFHEKRDQGSLKDKARNMKVDFLISRAPLPNNFDRISLGKKEIDKVLSRGQNPYRKEGEIVGQEELDMDGLPRGVFD